MTKTTTKPQAADVREALNRLVSALAKVSPIETNDTPDYAELTFGDHKTQAMTMVPKDWNDIEAAYLDAQSALASQPTPSAVGEDVRAALARNPAGRCYTVSGSIEERQKTVADWVRRAMRFIDLADADPADFVDNGLHETAERLTIDGYFLFGADAAFDQWSLADLEHRQLTAFMDRLSPQEAWQQLVEYDDRTSPEEYPDMALITFDELADFMSRTAALAAPAPQPLDATLREKVARMLGEIAIPDPWWWRTDFDDGAHVVADRMRNDDLGKADTILALAQPKAIDAGEDEAQFIGMVRVEVESDHEDFAEDPKWDVWFRDRVELDGFLAGVRAFRSVTVTDIHERTAHTAASAMDVITTCTATPADALSDGGGE